MSLHAAAASTPVPARSASPAGDDAKATAGYRKFFAITVAAGAGLCYTSGILARRDAEGWSATMVTVWRQRQPRYDDCRRAWLRRLTLPLVLLYVAFGLATALHQHGGTSSATGTPAACATDAVNDAGGSALSSPDCALCFVASQPTSPGTDTALPRLRPVEHIVAASPVPAETQLFLLLALSRYAPRAPPVV